MQKRKWIGSILLFLLCLGGCGAPVTEAGLFSWKESAITDYETLFSDMKELGMVELYQEISDDIETEMIKKFLTSASEQEIAVYLLIGEPDWVLEKDAESLLEEMQRIGEINELVEETAELKGVMVDVEPYLLEEWDDERDELMQCYVDCMKETYDYATEQGIEVILCIPYFYDNKGYSGELETLIAEACDGIAVMNYYRNMEVAHIEQEVAYAAKYEKDIITIYEMKEAGSHGLTPQNTYFELGFGKVKDNFRDVYKAYRKQNIRMAYHDYEAVKEILLQPETETAEK